jgi:hypothetical protein
LDDFVSGAGEFAPVAGLVRVLLDRLIFASMGEKASRAKAQRTSSRDRGRASIDNDLWIGHELLGDGLENGVIEHDSDFKFKAGHAEEKVKITILGAKRAPRVGDPRAQSLK